METARKPITKEWLTYGQVEVYCSLSRWTVARAVRDGELRAARVGRKVLVERTSLDEFLEERRVGG